MTTPDLPAHELSPREEQTLARNVVSGDRQALERFHALYAESLYRFVFYRLGGVVADTEEVVQETFLAALESAHRFQARSSLFTWLCGIAKHRIARTRRARSRERIASALAAVDSEIDRMLSQLESEELPDDVLEREETHDLVGATMASLPPAYQGVLIDKYVHALSVRTMARQRGATPKSVESTLTRARVAFRKTFALLTRRLEGGARHA